MTSHLTAYDNNIGYPLQLSEEQRADLSCIAGKPIKELIDEESGRNLLVFPDDLNTYGDKIGNSQVFHISGNELYTGNIMGFVGIGSTMVKIGSRFDRGRKDFFMHYMLEKVMAINLFDLDHSTAEEQIFDFLPFMFPMMLKIAMSQGLYNEYRTFKRNDSHPRGVLDVARHIRLNYPATGNIAYRTREHTADNAVTQIIRHTIEYISTQEYGNNILSCDEDTRLFVSQVKEATPTYNRNEREQMIAKNLRPKIHPYYSGYASLTKLCVLILRNEQIKYGRDDDTIHGILFDGAWLWEEYLNTILSPCGIEHPRNKTGEGKLHLFKGNKAPRFPDFYGKDIVLDAKYKGYANSSVDGIGREDLAQVISYMYIRRSRVGVFLAPGKDYWTESSLELNGYDGIMSLLCMPISSADNYTAFRKKMKEFEVELSERLKNIIGTVQ